MSLVLFDLDHTLLDGDSNSLWLDFLQQRGLLDAADVAKQAEFMALYARQELDIAAYLEFHLGLLTRHPMPELLRLREDFMAEVIKPRIGAAAFAAVAQHVASGARVAIITATHSFLVESTAALFGVPVICSVAEVRQGAFTGRLQGMACFAGQKIDCLKLWLQQQGLDESALAQATFYSDSANDLPLLEAVAHPVVVNPDATLQATAQARGWPVQHWLADGQLAQG